MTEVLPILSAIGWPVGLLVGLYLLFAPAFKAFLLEVSLYLADWLTEWLDAKRGRSELSRSADPRPRDKR